MVNYQERRRATTRERKFQDEVERILRRVNRLDDDAVRETLKILSTARDQIISTLGGLTQSEFQIRNMTQILEELNIAIDDFRERYTDFLGEKIDDAVDLGREFVDRPIIQAGVGIGAEPVVTEELLEVGLQLSSDLVTDVSDAMRKKINTSVRLGLLGEKSPQDIIRELSKDKRFRRGVFKSVKDRAEVVTRTEVNRALNLSTQKRFEQWSQQVPEMRKYWLHTRDSRVRPSHSAVGTATNPTLGGKPIPAKSSFRVGGFAAMGPHSVTLPARETVNCRCVLVSVFDEEKKEAIKKETIKKELIKREKWLARRPTSTEHAFIFDKNDNLVFSKTGGISQVEFTHQELSKFGKNAVFTHNHPAGNSFSFEDIGMAIDWDMAEMRAVGSQFTYSMKRPKSGWPVLSANSPVFKSAFRDKLQQWKSHYVSQVENKKISLEDANMNIFNDIWKDMAKEFKLIYTRKGS